MAIVNPGSASLPKDGTHSCMLYENGAFTAIDLETGEELWKFTV